jgi:hypothetical protein
MENTYASQARTITKNLQPHNAKLRGVADKKFFLHRIAKLYGYPHYKSTEPTFVVARIYVYSYAALPFTQ